MSRSEPPEYEGGTYRIAGPARIDIPLEGEREEVVLGGEREQELTIRDRQDILFENAIKKGDGDEALRKVILRRPFAQYLRTTPAQPLSTGAKVLLYAAGAIVAIVLLAALYKANL